MKTRLYNQVNVLHVFHSVSGRTRAVIFYDESKNRPSALIERMFNGCRWSYVIDNSDLLKISGYYSIHHRGNRYVAQCGGSVIEKLQAHKGKHYVYICG